MTSDWQWLSLADVLIVRGSGKPLQQGWSPRCHPHPASSGKWGVLKTTAIQAGWFDPSRNKELPEELDPRPQLEVHAGDLLMTCAGPRARCGVPTLVRQTPDRLMMSGKMYRFRPDERLDPSFLELWLLSPVAQKRIDAMKTGISDSGLNLTHDRFVQLPVPVPPLDEQRRIVDLLADHLSRLDAAVESLRTSLRRADAMVVSSLAAQVTAGSEQWPASTVGKRAEVVQYGSGAKCGARQAEDDVPVLRMGNVKDGALVWGSLKYLPPNHEDFPKLLLKPGDLLFNRTNSAEHVGKSAVFDLDCAASFASYLIRVRFGSEVLPAWASMVINSPVGREYVASVVSQQVGQANVNGTKLKAFPLPLPSCEEQDRRVCRHARIVESRDRLGDAIDTAATRAAGLRRSLLAAAFSGCLTGSASDLSVAEEMIGA